MTFAPRNFWGLLQSACSKICGFLLVSLLGLLAAVPAHAAPGVLLANTMTAPGGLAWLPDAAGGHLWVADGALGLCRLDPAGAIFVPTRCDVQVKSPVQFVEDTRINADGTFFLYVADRATQSNGVARLRFNPVTGAIVAGSLQTLAGGNLQKSLRPTAVALNPVDGNVYIGFIKSANIVRISTPNGAAQTATNIGTTSDGRKGTTGLAVDAAGQLFISEKAGSVTVITAVQQCETVVGGITVHCGAALPTPIQSFFPATITNNAANQLFIAEAPALATAGLASSALRYTPATDVQDVISSTHAALPDGTTVYKGMSALAVDPAGNLYIGDDATLGTSPGQGHLWVVAGAVADTLGAPGLPALAPPAPASGPLATLNSWGHQAPNGFIWLPGALGGHLWAADESGLCRLDSAPNGPNAINVEVCDPGNIGTPASPALDPVVNADGTQYLYIPEIDRFSAGVWRAKFDPSTETILPNPELMVPFGNLGFMRPNAVAIGPDGNLYVTGKGLVGAFPGTIYRITGRGGAIRLQTLTAIGVTSDGRGTNGSMAFVGNDLYLPENNDLGVMRNAVACNGACVATPIPLQNVFFGAAVATDGTNVYVANSPGASPAVIVRYNTVTGRETVLINGGAIPAGTTATTNVNPNQGGSPVVPNVRSAASLQDPFVLTGAPYPFRFILAMYVDPAGNLYFGDDPFAGARAQRGHSWMVPSVASIP